MNLRSGQNDRSRSGSRDRGGDRNEASRSPGRGSPGRGPGRRDPATKESKANRVFVGNLSFNTSWQNLKDHMRKAGDVLKVDIFSGPSGRSKGCGYIINPLFPKNAEGGFDLPSDF